MFVVAISFTLIGCSGNSQQQETTTPTSSEEISNVDPELTGSGFVRGAITDPTLYDYLNKQSSGLTSSDIVTTEENVEKIGKTSTFNKNSRLGLSGIAQILSTNKIKITSFNYNGSCGPIYFGLATLNNLVKPLAKLKEISTSQTNSSFDLIIPTNVRLVQFEALGIYCYTKEEPVSTANF